jgi:hypothetical protein
MANSRQVVAPVGETITDGDSAGNLKKLAEEFDKETWNSEAQATFSNTTFRPVAAFDAAYGATKVSDALPRTQN